MRSCLALAGIGLMLGCRSGATKPPAADAAAESEWVVIEGEYSPVAELVVAWDEGLSEFFLELLAAAWDEATITVVLDPGQSREVFDDALAERGLDAEELHVVTAPIESVWLRDFGPLTLRTRSGKRRILDFHYFGGENDDVLLSRLSGALWPGWQLVSIGLELEGGNLLSDGTGRCVTTESALAYNPSLDETQLRRMMASDLGCRDLIILAPLAGEATGHVDMFVTVTGPGEAIVGSYDAELDPDNADLTDRSARQLERAGFHVRRVPMPTNTDGVFRSYTNALALNDVVLLPIYPEDPSHDAAALRVFQDAYPGRDVVPIDSSAIIELSGAVHCAAMTIGP
jgi:agmatine deiminase